MGFLSNVKDKVTPGGSKGHEDIGQEFEEEISQQEEGLLEEDFDDEIEEGEGEEVKEEWETAYQFAFDMIEEDGFADMSEFITKFMFYEVKKSPRYRDRLRQGAETIEMVTNSIEMLQNAGNSGGDSDFEELADKMEAADRAVKAADSLSGKEEMMTQDLINLGYEAVDKVGQNLASGGGNVESSVTESDREI